MYYSWFDLDINQWDPAHPPTSPESGKYNQYIDYEDILSFGSLQIHLVPLLMQEAFEWGGQINSSQKAVERKRVGAQLKSLPGGGAAYRGQFNLDKAQTASTQVVQGLMTSVQLLLRFTPGTDVKSETPVWWPETGGGPERPTGLPGLHGAPVEWVYFLNLPVGGRAGIRPAGREKIMEPSTYGPGSDGGSNRVILILHPVSDPSLSCWHMWCHVSGVRSVAPLFTVLFDGEIKGFRLIKLLFFF